MWELRGILKRSVFTSLLLFSFLCGVELASAQTAADGAAPSLASSKSNSKLEGEAAKAPLLNEPGRFSRSVTLGYYAPVSDIKGLKIDPFLTSVGLAFAYMLDSGISFGVHGQIFLGRTVSQVYVPRFSLVPTPVHAESQLFSLAGTASFERRLAPLVIRYSLDLGVSALSWDFGNINRRSLAAFESSEGLSVGWHFSPGIGVLYPIGRFFAGADLHYRIEMNSLVPHALGGSLHSGWRF